MADSRILIAGGGIGGLAAALVLGRAGHVVDVLEQADGFREIGAGIQIGPNAFRLFEHLQLTDAITRVAYFPEHLCLRDVLSGETVIRVPAGSNARKIYGYSYGVIHRADIHNVFLDACRSLANVRLYTNARIERFVDQGDSVRVQLADGRSLHAAALIGADGLWSTVRQAILGDGPPRVSGHIAYRAVLRAEDVPKHLFSPDVTLWGGEKTHLVHYPLRRGELFNLVAVFHSDRYEEGWDTYGDPAELEARFAAAAPQVRELLARIETWKMWVLCDREPVASWSRGRVTLLGDAAHPMLQYLAQGACMAIEDAVTLGKAITHTQGDLPAAFAAYETARYLRTGRVQLTARLYGDIYHASGVARELRNALFRSGEESAGFLGQGWLYRGIEPDRLFA